MTSKSSFAFFPQAFFLNILPHKTRDGNKIFADCRGTQTAKKDNMKQNRRAKSAKLNILVSNLPFFFKFFKKFFCLFYIVLMTKKINVISSHNLAPFTLVFIFVLIKPDPINFFTNRIHTNHTISKS